MDEDTNEDNGKKSVVKTVIQSTYDFSTETTLHGVRFITGEGIHFGRSWLILELKMSIDKFFAYPVVTVVIINHVPEVYFPAITICNQNMIKADNAENHKIFLELLEASSTGEGTIHWDLYDNVTKDYMWNLTDWAFQDGHKIEDMLLECKWKLHQHCSPEDFRPIMTDFGVCFTYNWDEHNPLPVGHPGSSYGLILRLNIEQDQYTWSEFGGAGLKVYAHAQGEMPLVKMHGFSVGPGMETDITLRYIKRKNLKSPYKPYCDEKQLKYSHIYNAELCRFECEVDAIIEQCGCKDYRHPGDVPVCDPKQHIQCVLKVQETFSSLSNLDHCICPEPCEQEYYDTKNSIAQWPSNYLRSRLSEEMNITEEYIGDNFLELNIFFEEVRFEEITEAPAYDGYSLLGDVGGYMGLLCGASLITMVEIMDCILITFTKTWRKPKRRIKSTEYREDSKARPPTHTSSNL